MRMLLLKTWRDILARKGQFAALVMLVAIGIMAYVSFISSYYDLVASKDEANARLRFADFTTTVMAAPASAARYIERLPGVATAEGRLVIDTGIEYEEGGSSAGDMKSKATARVVGIPLDRKPKTNAIAVLKGRMTRPSERDAVIINSKFASETGMKVGDTFELHTGPATRDVRVVGIGTSPEYLYPIRRKGEIPSPGDFVVIFAEQHQVEEWFGRPGGANDFAVTIDRGADLDAVIDAVEDELDAYYVIDSVKREDQPSNFGLNEEIEQNRVLADSLPILVLIISSSSLFIALSRLVQSQRGEIGLAKALGYADWQILAHYLAFTMLVALGGSVVGILLGQWFASLEADLYVSMLGIPFLAGHVYPRVIAEAVLMSTTACVLAGIFPAWNSARIPPAMAMHSDPNVAVKGGRIPMVEKLFGWAMPRGFTFRIPLRNVFRSRRRTAYTIVGIAFAMILTVATWSMFDAIDALMDKVFAHTELWDVLAAYEDRFASERINEVRGWKGIKGVDAALMLPVEVSANGEKFDTMLTAASPRAGFHGFDIVAGSKAPEALSAGGMVMAEAVAKRLGVSAGDTVRVDSPYVDDDISYRVLSISDETLGGPVFVEAEAGRDLLGVSRNEYNVLYLYVDPDRIDEIEEDLYDLPGATEVQVKASLEKKLADLMEFMDAYGGIMLGFGFALAAAVIYNTFTANIMERTREIATMRTIGESNARLAVMVTIENVFLALAAVPLGVWLGILAADAIYASFSTEAYSFKAVIYASSVASIVGINLVVLLLSEIPPIRRIFKMDLAEATKVME